MLETGKRRREADLGVCKMYQERQQPTLSLEGEESGVGINWRNRLIQDGRRRRRRYDASHPQRIKHNSHVTTVRR